MARVFYVHWNQEEAEESVKKLREAGHEVQFHASIGEHMRMGDFQPEAFVISMDRLPSHGKAVAEWFWEAKKRRVIPLIFSGGKPDKVESMRAKFPEAVYCGAEELLETVMKCTARNHAAM